MMFLMMKMVILFPLKKENKLKGDERNKITESKKTKVQGKNRALFSFSLGEFENINI